MDFLPSCKAAGTIIAASSFAGKFYMSFAWRSKMPPGTPEEKVKEIKASPAYVNQSAAQLNDAEYAPWLMASLFFLSSRGNETTATKTVAAIAAYGSVAYLWGRVAGVVPLAISGALSRYLAMAGIVGTLALEQ